MNIIFNREAKGEKFFLAHECAYCGKLCEGEFCCEAHENLFYSEEELTREEDVYADDDEDFEMLIREERKEI